MKLTRVAHWLEGDTHDALNVFAFALVYRSAYDTELATPVLRPGSDSRFHGGTVLGLYSNWVGLPK